MNTFYAMKINAPKIQSPSNQSHANLGEAKEQHQGLTLSPPPFQLTADPPNDPSTGEKQAPVQLTSSSREIMQLSKDPGQYILSSSSNLRDDNDSKTVLVNLPKGTPITIIAPVREAEFGTGIIKSVGKKNHYWVSAMGLEGWVKESAIGQIQQVSTVGGQGNPEADRRNEDPEEEKEFVAAPVQESPQDLVNNHYIEEGRGFMKRKEATLPSGAPNPAFLKVSLKSRNVSKFVAGVDLSAHPVRIVQTILANIISNGMFRYSGNYTSSLNFLSGGGSGDCQTLSDSIIEIFQALGIGDRIQKASRDIEGKDLKINVITPLLDGTTPNQQKFWQFDNHHWVIAGGVAYDVLFNQVLDDSTWENLDKSP